MVVTSVLSGQENLDTWRKWKGDDTWYENYMDAWNSQSLKVGQHAELRDTRWPIYGWTTHSCTITAVAVAERDGKYAPCYQNDYDNGFYLGSGYE